MNNKNQNGVMLRIEDIVKLNDVESLQDELKKREKLFDKIAGDLYRSIVWDEILDIRERIWQVSNRI